MARRATKMDHLRSSAGSSSTVFIAGPYELLEPGRSDPNGVRLRSFVQAMQELEYDLVVLSPEEAQLLRDQGLAIPQDWHVLDGAPELVTLSKTGQELGVLLLSGDKQPAEHCKSLLQGASASQPGDPEPSFDLLMAISCLGWQAEMRFLRSSPPGLDLLLGSGMGPYEIGRYVGPGRTLWIRPYSRGKAMNRITLRGAAGSEPQSGMSLQSELVVIESSIPKDPNIQALFSDSAAGR